MCPGWGRGHQAAWQTLWGVGQSPRVSTSPRGWVALVAVRLSRSLSLSFQRRVLKQALLAALQWGLSHNFSIRLYALVALKKVWAVCRALRVEECDAWTALVECSLSQAESMHGAG